MTICDRSARREAFSVDLLYVVLGIMGFLYWKEWVEFWKRSVERNDQEWVNDGSVDIKGRAALRATTGGWKASFFIIGVEFSERLTYYGIASNLIIYLTTVLRQGVATSAKNVNNWSGVTTVMPLVGAFLADAYTGRYWMVLISSIIYLLGLILLTLSVSLPAFKAPQCDQPNSVCNKATSTQIAVFFLALYLISFGTGGHKPCLQAFGADQFDEDDKEEKREKTSFFNWWYFGLSSGVLLAVTVVVYIQDNVSWGFGFGIPTLAMGVAIVFFLYGRPFYRHKPPSGSPITRIAQVIVAAIRNRNIPLPSDVGLLYKDMDYAESLKSGQRHLSHTNNFQFLDKAAIVQSVDENQRPTCPNPWKLCTVTQVEETKLVMRMVPIWLCCLIFGVTVAQGTTFFIKQGNTMDRGMGPHFQIPPASIMAFSAISTLVSVAMYDRCLFVLIGVADVFTLVGLQEYFYNQVHESMRSLGIAFYLSAMGVASFLSSLLITIVDKATKRAGHQSWFVNNLNRCRLDYFYWLLAILSAINLCFYVYVAHVYTYTEVQRRESGTTITALELD
eukprot:Gb_10650 [translate_table: standard]